MAPFGNCLLGNGFATSAEPNMLMLSLSMELFIYESDAHMPAFFQKQAKKVAHYCRLTVKIGLTFRLCLLR
jgi:hypothetical protein